MKFIEMFGFYSLISIIITILTIAFWYYKKVGRIAHYLQKCPGIPCSIPLFGNMLLLKGGLFRTFSTMMKGGSRSVRPDLTVLLLNMTVGLTKVFKDLYVFWVGWYPFMFIYKPEFVQVVLSSNKLIEKSGDYDVLHPWLGRGLLTNTGDNWRARRKLLTPTFHLQIINDFIPTMNEHSFKFVEILFKTNGNFVDIIPLVTGCTLDIICDCAMGVKINAQMNTDSEYVRAVNVLGMSFMRRNFNIKGWFDFIFYRTSYGKEYIKSLNILHNFTRTLIKDRKQNLDINNGFNEKSEKILKSKKRMAFLDLLLDNHLSSDSKLSEEEIREEVNTFMFEGHDTTSAAICWSLLLIGLDPEVQRKISLEIEEIFGDDRTRHITSNDLNRLKYVECCIKETLRIYPSVTAFARLATEDFQLGPYLIPKGTTLCVYTYALHRNEDVFPQPEIYRPERFMLGNTGFNERINPYSYIPFSAGPRNCIGKRFALSEMKIILTNIFRNFKIKSNDQRDRIRTAMELITRPKDPMRIQFSVK